MRVVLDYFWDMSRWMLLALPCWVLGRSLFLAAGRKKTRWGHEILLTLFVLALAGVLSQTVLPPPGQPILTPAQARARWVRGTVPPRPYRRRMTSDSRWVRHSFTNRRRRRALSRS